MQGGAELLRQDMKKENVFLFQFIPYISIFTVYFTLLYGQFGEEKRSLDDFVSVLPSLK